MSITSTTILFTKIQGAQMSQDKLTKLLENVEQMLRRNGQCNEWDSYVPVISKGHHHTVYLTEEFSDPSSYNQMCHLLMNASEVDEFTLVINSPGGILDSAFMVADAITRSQASVSAYVVGTVASAATIVALACDKLEASENLAFMIHNYSSGIQGKGHEMKARQTFIDNELNKSFERYYLGFLSEEEITDVIEGKDIWLNSQEVMQRWEIKQKNTLQFKQAS